MDFGTSFATEEATQMVFTTTLGTFQYNPPKSFGQEGIPSTGLAKRTGRSGYVFSIACAFYEILEALSIHANFLRVDGNYATCVALETFVDMVCGIKEHDLPIAKRLEEQYRLPGLVQNMLKLVVENMIVVPVQMRKDATSVLGLIDQNYRVYPKLATDT
jgi:hypothetical protein